MGWFRRASRAPKCKIDEEWGGVFIGRRWCATHQERWDDGGPCPATHEKKVIPTLEPGQQYIQFQLLSGKVLDFVLIEVRYDKDAITGTLQDRASFDLLHLYDPKRADG